jgi:uncharacterized SAM-dependent methyltransferase
MEVSQKYSEAEIARMGREAGYEPIMTFFDRQALFADVLWQKSQ